MDVEGSSGPQSIFPPAKAFSREERCLVLRACSPALGLGFSRPGEMGVSPPQPPGNEAAMSIRKSGESDDDAINAFNVGATGN
jgi:hypothetical protein